MQSHEHLDVYRIASEAARRVAGVARGFPFRERYTLTDPLRRSSQAVCTHIAEAWSQRSDPQAFASALNAARIEAAETLTWLHLAAECDYLSPEDIWYLRQAYDEIIGRLGGMATGSSPTPTRDAG
jgi:four helix bundle protein